MGSNLTRCICAASFLWPFAVTLTKAAMPQDTRSI